MGIMCILKEGTETVVWTLSPWTVSDQEVFWLDGIVSLKGIVKLLGRIHNVRGTVCVCVCVRACVRACVSACQTVK